MLIQATNSQHGLAINNRKFYWNSIENYFEPINYDSNSNIDAEVPSTSTAIYRLPISNQFIKAFERVAVLGTQAGVGGSEFKIFAPLIEMSKAAIIRCGTSLGLDYSLTHSCYDPGVSGAPCGLCDSCQLRARGFAEAGIRDPLL